VVRSLIGSFGTVFSWGAGLVEAYECMVN
jgi:hypothetical protein